MMENYEKKYKEALERARDLHDNHPLGQPQTWITCEKIFPELKESEDERIRKAIICGMNTLKEQHKETFASIPINDCIAWLEKQGEQKPADKIEPKFKVGDVIKNIKNGDTIKVEQILNNSYCYSGWDGAATIHSDFLISDQDNWELIKPTWSEEDEKRISRIADFIWKNRKGDTDEIYQQEQDVNWLKSLKPRWKPTEEQMEALKNRTHGLHTSSETRKILESLINDLEKL